MSFYGSKTVKELFSVHKHEVAANTSHRFGGTHFQVAYDTATGSAIEVVSHHSGVKIVNSSESAAAAAVTVVSVDSENVPTFAGALVDVDGTYNLASNTHALVLEGVLNSLDGNADIHHIAASESGVVITGTGKILTLTIA